MQNIRIESPKRKLKLKEQIINIKNSDDVDVLVNNIKRNSVLPKVPASSSRKEKKKTKRFSLPLYFEMEIVKKLAVQTGKFPPKEEPEENNNKIQISKKKLKYVKFKNFKIPKILLRQSNIFNAEIDKINEIVIDNYDKITPSSYKKSKKKMSNIAINVPSFSEENRNKVYFSNTFSNNFRKKFFPLPIVKNKNTNITPEEEDDIISYFEKK